MAGMRNPIRHNKVYDYSYTVKYDTGSCFYGFYADDAPYLTGRRSKYDFTAYTMDYQAMADLCNFIKSLPNVISCTLVQTCFGPYQLDFELEGIYGLTVKDFMDKANKKAKIEDYYSYISNKPNSFTISNERRNGKGIEKDMQKFTPKKVIYSGGKTIVIWPDNSKTIVSCGDGDQYDEYTGFCTALAKKIFGTTSAAKRAMNKNKKVDISKSLEEVDYEALKKSIQNELSSAIKKCLNMCSSMAFEEKLDDIYSGKEKQDEID